MQYLLYPAALIFGFIALIVGANIFVDGSSFVAKKLHVPPLIIGLTVVALGTSAPELAVSVTAAFQGSNELAYSNVIGSNIFNLLAVLGVCAVISPIPVSRAVTRRDLPVFLGVGAALALAVLGRGLFSVWDKGMSYAAGTAGRLVGAFLLVGFIVYMLFLIVDARRQKDPGDSVVKPGMSPAKAVVFILSGLALIVGGGQAVVYGARKLALAFGLSETLVGLTVVAVGTSLPELATSIVAAMKGETELAVGNAVGSNILNLMLILGISVLIHPIEVNLASVYDTLIMLAAGVLTLICALTKGRIGRAEGAVMFGAYVLSVVFAVIRS